MSTKWIKPPTLPWLGPVPYDVLNEKLLLLDHPLLGPESSALAINDADFALMAGDAIGYEDALAEPNDLPRRFFLDFCHYPLRQEEAEARPEGLPVSLGALRRLADSPPPRAPSLLENPLKGAAGAVAPAPVPREWLRPAAVVDIGPVARIELPENES